MDRAGPSDVMDVKSRKLQHDDRSSTTKQPEDFTVCDLADEEVHFSRHASDYYYRIENASDNLGAASSAARPNETRHSKIHSLDTNNLNFEPVGGHDFHYAHASDHDQATSSRLLHSIGCRLRRGSNYLNAPTKLLGHYLLGITIQSWSEFFNTSRMMKAPKTRHQLSRRLATNLSHFQGNYLCVSLILIIYCILTSPLLLIAIAIYLLALYLVTVRSALGKQTIVFSYRLNLKQQYSFITMFSLPPLWIAGAPSAVFWVIGASFFVIGLHASLFVNDLVLSEQLAAEAEAGTRYSLPYEMGAIRQAVDSRNPAEFGQPGAKRSSIEYYNHHNVAPAAQKLGYISLPHLSHSNVAPTSTGSSQSTRGYVSSAISQWIPFKGGATGREKYLHANKNHKTSGATTVELNYGRQQVADVKIVSHDYAGLGRVYEV